MSSLEDRRFAGVARLYGADALARFQRAHVGVIGVGGVGSWAVEALARSGVGRLTLIDLDHLSLSNINRQLPALDSTLGLAKVAALAARVGEIAPACQVHPVEEFVTAHNLATLVPPGFDWVLDGIDDFRVKAALIAHCRRQRTPLITVGGAGGQRDATRVQVSDLRRTEQDALLARTRRLLRREYGFPANPRRRFGVPCVWSDEPVQRPAGDHCDSGLNCAGYGSAVVVTATFGMAAAGHILQQLAEGEAETAR